MRQAGTLSARELSAVGGERGTGDEGSLVGGQEKNRCGDLFRLTDALHGHARDQVGFVRRSAGEAVQHAGLDWSRSDNIDPDAGLGKLEGRCFGKAFDSVLAANIESSARCSRSSI